MGIKEILNSTSHRPWELPANPWSYYQEWNDVLFLHYQVSLEELESFVPDGLELDLFVGKPWVSLVAFTMEKIRPRYIPSFAPISDFPEINVRTYVKANGKSGVYFLSIEAGKRLSCQLAKVLSGLPYRYSKIKRTGNRYESQNSLFGDNMQIQYAVGKDIDTKTELDIWLTERYALFQDINKSLVSFDLHHKEWKINSVEIRNLNLQYERFGKLINNNPDRMHYSKGVKVLAWGKTRH